MTFNTVLVSCRGNIGKLYSCNTSDCITLVTGRSEICTYDCEILSENGTIHRVQCVSPEEIEVIGGDAIAH